MNKHIKAFLVVLILCAVTMSALHRGLFDFKTADSPLPGLPTPRFGVAICPLGRDVVLPEAEITEFLQQTVGQTPVFLPAVDLPEEALDARRGQWDCERLLGHVPVREGYVTVAIASQDVFTSAVQDWRWCFGSRSERTAVLSTWRMGLPGEAVSQRRNKMTLRYVLEMAYGLPRNERQGSILYRSIGSARDLDNLEFRL